MIDISFQCHFQSTCKRFKDTFYLVMLILSFSLDVQIHFCSITQ